MDITQRIKQADKAAATARATRAAEIAELFSRGLSKAAIGRQYGLTRERVRQILNWHRRQTK
jgi:DNA-binding CsgD family transcriptional regulator